MQDHYEGLIQPTNSDYGILPYSFTSLTNHRIQLQTGEQVYHLTPLYLLI